MRPEVFTTMKIQVTVFWVMISCSDVAEYQCFGGPCCFNLDAEEVGSNFMSQSSQLWHHVSIW